MKVQCGWASEYDRNGKPTTLHTVVGDDLQGLIDLMSSRYSEVLTKGMSLQEVIDTVDMVNSEGNYHEFIFRIIDVGAEQSVHNA